MLLSEKVSYRLKRIYIGIAMGIAIWLLYASYLISINAINKNTSIINAEILLIPVAQAHSDVEAVDKRKIGTLISNTFDQPQSKVQINPIVIEGKVAIADWVQDKKGGRALLRKNHDQWEIIACGGSGFKTPNGIAALGIPKEAAQNIIAKLNAEEAKLSTQQIKQFDSFDGVVNMAHSAKHSPTKH